MIKYWAVDNHSSYVFSRMLRCLVPLFESVVVVTFPFPTSQLDCIMMMIEMIPYYK